ncbi:MAG TPA: glutamate-5-semialdehyde dehydrogenase [Clostridiaceae bacterium]|nr:glutamate-5-semialdehyde dehydrogenase [Clostridiaceae bacterium]
MDMRNVAINAKSAAIKLSGVPTQQKNHALKLIAEKLYQNRDAIYRANEEDIERSMAENLAMPLIKRLRFDEKKLLGVIEGINSLINLEDPVGKTLLATELDEGLELYRVSCPIGVIGIIFESRPDALVQISTLCLKSGNAVLLKGGREAQLTNRCLYETIASATREAGIPDGWINLLESRDEVSAMLKLDEYIDLIIPRGSNEFVRYIMDNSRIPVLGHADGICHCYVDSDHDLKKAVDIVVDSKTQYVAVCNALETLLVHKDIAETFLPAVKVALEKKNVVIKGCERTRKIISCQPADEEDWKTEYLDYIISIKIVDSIEDAIDHINTYGSGHTDVILSRSKDNISKFLKYVDSGDVFVNCSTRFSDGFRYGFGAEVGISTNKIHARGPVGLEGLVTYKYMLMGDGHIVADYAENRKSFTHRPLKKEFRI